MELLDHCRRILGKSLNKRGSVYILGIIVEESAKFKEKQEQQFRQSKHNMNANTKL
jgi:hypothetical protein